MMNYERKAFKDYLKILFTRWRVELNFIVRKKWSWQLIPHFVSTRSPFFVEKFNLMENFIKRSTSILR